MFKELQVVKLTRDVAEHGLKAGDAGAVVHVYPGERHVEVEFVEQTGRTKALLMLSVQDVEVSPHKEALVRKKENWEELSKSPLRFIARISILKKTTRKKPEHLRRESQGCRLTIHRLLANSAAQARGLGYSDRQISRLKREYAQLNRVLGPLRLLTTQLKTGNTSNHMVIVPSSPPSRLPSRSDLSNSAGGA